MSAERWFQTTVSDSSNRMWFQVPLEHNTKAFTAFITFSGVYEFTRLPFGPKRAPSYFQQITVTIVLVGLIYMLCEMYIDDFGDTNDEFVSRSDSVLSRFCQCKIRLPTQVYMIVYEDLVYNLRR